MARHQMPATSIKKSWWMVTAQGLSLGAALVEHTANRPLEQAGRLSFQQNPLSPSLRVGDGDS